MYTCLSPLTIFNDCQDRYINVPCGHCYNCQMRKRAEWDLRLYVTSLYSKAAAFVTYTYEDDYLCVAHSYREFQLRHKRMRNDGLKFSFYHISEFGERFGRPHNHELIFFHDEIDPRIIYRYFDYGLMDVGSITSASIHYVTKWHVHPKYRSGESLECHGFSRMSKGLGAELLVNMDVDNFRPTYKLPNGSILPISRYYRKKLAIDSSDFIPKTIYDQFRHYYPGISDQGIQMMIMEIRENNALKQRKLRISNINLQNQ